MARKPNPPKSATSGTDIAKAANPVPTFDINDPAFQQILAQAMATRQAAIEANKADKIEGVKSDRAVKNELHVIRAFKKAG
jgi:hypothetical protein